jgi:multidrug efflux system outer membrane protein
VLDALEASGREGEPTLRAALARYDEALAAARAVRGSLYPTLSVNLERVAQRVLGNRQTEFPRRASPTRPTRSTCRWTSPTRSTSSAPPGARSRARGTEAEAQGATYQNVLLTLEAGVAQNYFTLRSLVRSASS